MTDIDVDADAMAADADSLGMTSLRISDVRDAINDAWKRGPEAFGDLPAAAAFDGCCSTWVGALTSIGTLVEGTGHYTQDVANAFDATDTLMSGGMASMYDEGDLPEEGETRTEVDPNDPNLI